MKTRRAQIALLVVLGLVALLIIGSLVLVVQHFVVPKYMSKTTFTTVAAITFIALAVVNFFRPISALEKRFHRWLRQDLAHPTTGSAELGQ